MKQLHNQSTFDQKYPYELAEEQQEQALWVLVFLKEKKDGRVKARAWANGRKQRDTSVKWDATSRTVALELVLLSYTIDAREGRDMAVTNIPGAFLHADMDDDIFMLLEKAC